MLTLLQVAPGPGRTLSSGSARRATETYLAASSPPARVAAVASDLASLLARFAFRRSFSDESHGGGKHSNARLLLYLLQMGRYFADFAAESELQVRVVLPAACLRSDAFLYEGLCP